MRIIIPILALISFNFVYSQYANLVIETLDEWDYTYAHDYRNNKFYSVGAIYDSNSTLNGFTTIAFRVYDESFQKQFETRYSDSLFQYTGLYGLEFHKGHYFHCGTKRKYPVTSDSLTGFVIKYDTLGNVVWEKNYYLNDEDVRINFMASDDSLIYLLSNVNNPTQGVYTKTVLTAIDSSGSIIWDKEFTGISLSTNSLIKTSDGGFLVCASNDHGINTQSIVYKLDSLHNTKWTKTLGPSSQDHYLQFFETSFGSYLGIGQSDNLQTGWANSWLVALDKTNGNVLIDTVYSISSYFSGFNLFSNTLLLDTEMLITGISIDNINDQDAKAFVMSMSYNYEINWLRKYKAQNIDNSIFNIYKLDDFYYTLGIVKGDGFADTYDEWFMVIDNQGCNDQPCTVGIKDNNDIVSEGEVISIYPNPASVELYISTQNQISTVKIYKITGEKVYEMLGDTNHINISNLELGIYTCVIELQHGQKFVQKFIVN